MEILKTFYLISSICFLLLFSFNLWNFILIYKGMNFPSLISYLLGNLFFNLLLSILFIYFYFNTPSMNLIPDKDMIKVLDEYNLDERRINNYEKKI